MKIEKLIIKNIGPYYTNDKVIKLDFESDVTDDITVFIGKNGDGKTSLLSAIKVALLGYKQFELSGNTKAYNNKIADFINSRALSENLEAILEIHFKIPSELSFNSYVIKRVFTANPVSETVSYRINGIEVKGKDIINMESFLDKTITKEVLDMFVFDAEEIYTIFGSNEISKYIDNIFNNLFNVSLYKKSIARLEKYKKNVLSKSSDNALVRELLNIEKEIEIIDVKIDKTRNLKSEYSSMMEEADNAIRELSNKYEQVVGVKLDFDYNEIVSNIKKEKDKVNFAFKKSLERDITFLMNKDLVRSVKVKMDNGINDYIREIANQLENKKPDISKLLLNHIDEETSIFNKKPFDPKVDKRIDEILEEDLTETKNALNEIISQNLNSKKLNDIVKNASDDAVKDIVNELNNQVSQSEKLSTKQRDIEIELDYLLSTKSRLVTEKMNIINNKNLDRYVVESTTHADAQINNIKDIINKVYEVRGKEISEIATMTFNKLNRKNEFIDKIVISKTNISLESKNQKILTKHLSAGEKQLLFLAITDAIIKTSKYNFTYVVDSFFSRLDTEHRRTVAKELLVDIPNQKILLTTDADFTNELRDTLGDKITNIYRLKFNDNEKYTKIIKKRGN